MAEKDTSSTEQQKRTITAEQLEDLKEKSAEHPGLLPYAHTAGGAVIKPEDKGKIKGRAVSAMREQTDMQMGQLYEQMRVLAEQAEAIKTRLSVSERIYEADIPFDPLISHVYHLYQKKDGNDVLSMVDPSEWGRSTPFERYVATVKLLADHTWEILRSAEEEEGGEDDGTIEAETV